MKNFIHLSFLLSLATLITACGGQGKTGDTATKTQTVDSTTVAPEVVDKVTVRNAKISRRVKEGAGKGTFVLNDSCVTIFSLQNPATIEFQIESNSMSVFLKSTRIEIIRVINDTTSIRYLSDEMVHDTTLTRRETTIIRSYTWPDSTDILSGDVVLFYLYLNDGTETEVKRQKICH
jgi:hypothetical protein